MRNTNNGKKGGYLKGQSHQECNDESGCGIRAVVTDAGGKPVELEGDEVILTKKAMADEGVYEIKGTPKEIASYINHKIGGGVKFDDAPDSAKKIFAEGGEITEDAINSIRMDSGGDISDKIRILKEEGYPQKQAVAIAHSMKERRKLAKGGGVNSEPLGDCYVIAGQVAMDIIPKDVTFIGTPYVVHGEVTGQGAIEGVKYGHAWIEDDENVYDWSNNRELVFPKDMYYLLGGIEDVKGKVYRYTFAKARKKMIDTGHYGAWDLKTKL